MTDALDDDPFGDLGRWEPDLEPRQEPPRPRPTGIRATPFVWRDPALIPRRQWLYGRHLIRAFISTTIAPGGVGKSSLVLVEAIAMVTGRNLLGHMPAGRFRVWVWNGEDPLEEIERRIAAICIHYAIDPAELAGKLFVDSGRDSEIVIATTTRTGTEIARPVVDAMNATIAENAIDVVFIDPFVSSHRVSENDNLSIDIVCKTWGRIAGENGCAIELVHHARKTNGSEITVEDGRGAVALLAASRSARALNSMTKDEASSAGVEQARSHFRVDNGKANLAPPPDRSEWFKLVPVSLGNGEHGMIDTGDHVAVVTSWEWPDTMADFTVAHLRSAQAAVAAGKWRENHQAKDWVGHPIAKVLGLDPLRDRKRILAVLKVWLGTGMFVVVEGLDERREKRTFVEVGEAASD